MRCVILLAVAACDLQIGLPHGTGVPVMDVEVVGHADGTADITGCWSQYTSPYCSQGGDLVVQVGAEQVRAEFELSAISSSGAEAGRFKATTDRIAPGSPIEIRFDGAAAATTLPLGFELIEPTTGATVSAANPRVRATWKPAELGTTASVVTNYRCEDLTSSRSSVVTLASFSGGDPGTAELDLGVIAGPGESCTFDLIVQHANVIAVPADPDGGYGSLAVSAHQNRQVSVRLIP